MPRWSPEQVWSPQQLRELRRLAALHTAPRVAQILGRTVNAVRQKGRLIGVRFAKAGERHWRCRHPEATVERVRQLHDGGKKPAAIARELGLKHGTVKSWCYYQTRQSP